MVRFDRGQPGAVSGGNHGLSRLGRADRFSSLQFPQSHRFPRRFGQSSDRLSFGGDGHSAALLHAQASASPGRVDALVGAGRASGRHGFGGAPALETRPTILYRRHQPSFPSVGSARLHPGAGGCSDLPAVGGDGGTSVSFAVTSVEDVVVVLAAMTSESDASASARNSAPTRRFSSSVLTTGTLRCSLASNTGRASSNFWPGTKQGGTGRMMSTAMTALNSPAAARYSFKSCKASKPTNRNWASTTGR